MQSKTEFFFNEEMKGKSDIIMDLRRKEKFPKQLNDTQRNNLKHFIAFSREQFKIFTEQLEKHLQ